MRALIIDDEQDARTILSTLVEKYCPQIEIIGEAKDGREAIEKIKLQQPDLVFLDIEMPFHSGFEVLEAVEGIPLKVIFTTAYEEFALQAFEASAIQYLLKPIKIDQLKSAVEQADRFQSLSTIQQQSIQHNIANQQLEKLALPTMEGFEIIEIQSIEYIEAADSMAKIVTQSGEFLVSRTLKYYSDLLINSNFIRVHKSYTVNTLHIKKYVKGSGGYLVMESGATIQVSAERKQALTQVFKQGKF